MDTSFFIQLLVFSPLIFVPVLTYIIVGRLFRVKDKYLKIIISLVISLAFASIFLPILGWAPLVYKFIDKGYLPAIIHFSPVFPWTDCNKVEAITNTCPYGAVCESSAQSRIGFYICNLMQYYEWALMAAAMLFILAFLISARAKKK
jgi:hypothetical protein